jgi:hypothetical protein
LHHGDENGAEQRRLRHAEESLTKRFRRLWRKRDIPSNRSPHLRAGTQHVIETEEGDHEVQCRRRRAADEREQLPRQPRHDGSARLGDLGADLHGADMQLSDARELGTPLHAPQRIRRFADHDAE